MTAPPFQLIDQQPGFVLVNKAPGIGFHQENDADGLFQSVKSTLQIDTLFPVHRLDKVTSGLIVFATDAAAARELGEHFAHRQIDKYYLALSRQKPKKKQGTIIGDMEKSRRGTWRLTRQRNNPAVTHFKSYGTPSGLRVFLLKPATGKTHQIRVALKSLGAPIIGDPLYESRTHNQPPADRCYLHAFALSFTVQGKQFAYCNNPEAGELFRLPVIAKIINEQLAPPWEIPLLSSL